MIDHIWDNFQWVRKKSPLVHNITNYVVMNNTANALLAIGASPVMAHAVEEVEDMVKIAGSLVINIGTLSPAWVKAMKLAIIEANKLDKPVILDPVGAGATAYRNRVITELLETGKFTVIRGNASEIIAMASTRAQTKGVDSTNTVEQALDTGKKLAAELGCVVCISGKTDVVIGNNATRKIHNGHELMSKVTGLGCTATALIGAFTAVIDDPFMATISAMAVMGVTGELAAKDSCGPGSLQTQLIDKLYNISREEFLLAAKIE